jgi:peptidoglycan biosynthesis protein MviN/MurJ (putative lipid II flippase)
MQIALAAGVMALLLWQISPALSAWGEWQAHERLLRLALIIALAVTTYVATLGVLGMRPAVLRRH